MHYLTFFLLTFIIIIALLLVVLHLGFRAPRIKEVKTPKDFGLQFLEVTIPANSGKQLFGWLLPVVDSKETIIILHGWGGNAQDMLPIALPFHRAGMNILLVDARNHGQSDSDTFSSMPRFAEDLGHAINWLKQFHSQLAEKIAVLGHSVGAGAVLLEASKRSDIKAVISISAFAHPESMMRRYLQHLHLPGFTIRIILSYVQWLIGHRFSAIAPVNTVCNISCPVLLVHGKEDSTVPVDDARTILSNCPESRIELIEIHDAGHDSVDKIEQHGEKLISFLHESGFNVSPT